MVLPFVFLGKRHTYWTSKAKVLFLFLPKYLCLICYITDWIRPSFFLSVASDVVKKGRNHLYVLLLPMVVLVITNVDMILLLFSSLLRFVGKLSNSWHSGNWCKLLCLMAYLEPWRLQLPAEQNYSTLYLKELALDRRTWRSFFPIMHVLATFWEQSSQCHGFHN